MRHRRHGILLAWAAAFATAATLAALALPAGASPASGAPRAGGVRPHATSTTIDPYGPEGMNVLAAQQDLTEGDPHVIVAYVEGGINWHSSTGEALADAVDVNWHELPVPCHAATAAACTTVYSNDVRDYAPDGDVTAADWAGDPRVTDANHNGVLDPEDLIAAFSGPRYHPPTEDPPGFAKAISGWDFYDDQADPDGQNDPATVDAAYGHSDDQMTVIHTICPKCTILPVKAGDEAIDSTDDLAKAWLFAAESGARVIVSVTADLGYSTFAEKVLAYLDKKGVAVVESSNDFDSTDHQGGMYWGNVLPGNGLVPNTSGVPSGSVLAKLPGPYWTRSDLTSWGVHNEFSVATYGGSTSESTPTLGAILALELSEGLKAHVPLDGAQAVQVLREASSQLPHLAKLPWPATAGEWNPQYGYGMPDVLTALRDVAAGAVPASPEITSPAWYTLTDPKLGGSVTVDGRVVAASTQRYDWTLQYGLGDDPSRWHTLASGARTGPFTGTFGSLALSRIPKAFYAARYGAATDKELSATDRYDVTLRITTSSVTAGRHLTGEARRVVDAFSDPTALAGFPLQVGSSGESQPALVDLEGTGRLDIVFGTADGAIDAIDPVTGTELPGWPAHTDAVRWPAPLPGGISAGDEPIIADVAVGDLDHDGALSVVATSIDGRVYVFDAHGRLERGWPQRLATGVRPPAIPRPALAHVRLPAVGALAAPVLVALEHRSQLDIVQAGWDGRLHAFTPSGENVPGWPVHVTLPAADAKAPSGYTLEDDEKLESPPAVAYFTRGGPPSLVVRSQFTDISSAALQPLPYAYVFAYSAAGKLERGWPVRLEGTIEDYGSAQEFITEGTDAPAAAPIGVHGVDDVAVGPIWAPESLVSATGKVLGSYGTSSGVLSALLGVELDPASAFDGRLGTETPTPFTGSGAFGLFGGKVAFAEPEVGAESFAAALLYDGSGNPIDDDAAVWPASAGASSGPELHGFPATEVGQDFLGAPMFAPVASGSADDVVVGGDASTVSATTSAGAEAAGFPKFTGGWTIGSPSAGDLFGDGHDDLVTISREGWLFAWRTNGAAPGAGSWWRGLHDEWNTSNLATDTRPPGVVRSASLSSAGELSFVAPGAHWYDGTVTRYDVRLAGSSHWLHLAAPGAAGAEVHLSVLTGTASLEIQAVNGDGLVSTTVEVHAS